MTNCSLLADKRQTSNHSHRQPQKAFEPALNDSHKPNNKSPPIYFWLSFETINVHNRRAERGNNTNWIDLFYYFLASFSFSTPRLSPPTLGYKRWFNDSSFRRSFIYAEFSTPSHRVNSFMNSRPNRISRREQYKYLKTINSLSAPLSFSAFSKKRNDFISYIWSSSHAENVSKEFSSSLNAWK